MRIFTYARTVTVLFLLFVTVISAQNGQGYQQGTASGKVLGVILDATSSTPIEYAAISLYKFKDSTLATGNVTNAKGEFALDKVPFGKYYMKITFIGYANKIVNDIMVTPKTLEANLGNIKIDLSSVTTKTVEVSANRDAITTNIDKKVIDVDKLLTSAGGNALDVMQNVPSVSVDADGTVSLRGNTNVTILIDGKPSQMAGLSSGDILAQIPASSIQSVEVITNPSVKYDPDGTSGIINIILKKKIESGMNGNVSATVGLKDKYNSSLNLNYNIGKFNFFGSYDARFNTFGGSVNSWRTSTFNNLNSYLIQSQDGLNQMRGHNLNIGFDYNFNDKNTLTVSQKYRNFNMDNSSANSDTTLDNFSALTKVQDRKVETTRKMNALQTSIGYRMKTDTKNEELTFDFNYDNNAMNSDGTNLQWVSLYGNAPSGYVSGLKTVSENTHKNWLLQGNYNHPFDDLFKYEIGFKSTYKELKSYNDYYSADQALTNYTLLPAMVNHFFYNEQIHAVYGVFAGGIWGNKFQVGLRAEQVDIDEKMDTDKDSYKNSYFSLYPSVHLSREIAEGQDLAFSYSRRVDRPNNRQLSPYVDYSDSLNVMKGNPYLNPQYTNSYELLHSLILEKSRTSLYTTLFYRRTNDIIATTSSLNAQTGVTTTSFENMANNTSYGVELIFMQPLAQWWRFSGTFSYFNAKIEGPNSSNESNSWVLRLNSGFVLPYDLSIQAIYSYSSPSIMASFGGGPGGMGSMAFSQTKMKAMSGLDLALKKDFLEGRLSVTLRVSDIFNTRSFDSETNGGNFVMNSFRKMDSRMAFLGISYRLSNIIEKAKEKRTKTDDSSSDDF